MRIVVNDLAASASGALSVLKSFYDYVKENDKENEYIFLLSGYYVEETERIKVVVISEVKKSGFHKLYFDLFSGKNLMNQFNPDYVISLQNIITFGYKGKQAVFVHQAIPFQNRKSFSFFKRDERTYAFIQTVVGYFIKKSIKKADRVFVQTNWMKEAIIGKCRIADRNVHVIPPEYNINNKYQYKLERNQFFYPAAFENIYKNQTCIYEAAEILNQKKKTDFSIILTLDKKHQQKYGCEFVGLLDKEQLYEYYSSSILVFPSYIETVGLPLIEAMSVGAIIFVADCEYAHDVLKGYQNAFYFDPFKPEQLSELIQSFLLGDLTINNQETIIDSNNSGWQLLISIVESDARCSEENKE